MHGLKTHFLLIVWLVIAAIILPLPLLAQSGVGTVVAEATIFEDRQNDNAGGYDNVCIGNLDGLLTTRRALVRFDLPDIPPGSTVTRVVYDFTQLRVRFIGPGAPKTADLEMRRVTANWVEGTGQFLMAACGGGDEVAGVNWNNAPAVQGTVSADVFLPSTDNTPITIDTDIGTGDDGLIADVQAWVENPASNFGWDYRVASEGTLDNARLLAPGSLTVHWTVPPLEFEDGFESP